MAKFKPNVYDYGEMRNQLLDIVENPFIKGDEKKKQIKQFLQPLVSVANKRVKALANFEKKTDTRASALTYLEKERGKREGSLFSTRGLSYNQLVHEATSVMGFLASKTGTVTGEKIHRQQLKDALFDKISKNVPGETSKSLQSLYKKVSDSELSKMWDEIHRFAEAADIKLGGKQKGSIAKIASDELVQMFFNQRFMGDNTMWNDMEGMSPRQIVFKIEERARGEYEALQDEINRENELMFGGFDDESDMGGSELFRR